ncbi:hypothetical protein BD309DRAFT_960602 [Dichomitus squalens]|nr:hypothetical protein BD309DRAFT_960602 [Dichomitus squalens]
MTGEHLEGASRTGPMRCWRRYGFRCEVRWLRRWMRFCGSFTRPDHSRHDEDRETGGHLLTSAAEGDADEATRNEATILRIALFCRT